MSITQYQIILIPNINKALLVTASVIVPIKSVSSLEQGGLFISEHQPEELLDRRPLFRSHKKGPWRPHMGRQDTGEETRSGRRFGVERSLRTVSEGVGLWVHESKRVLGNGPTGIHEQMCWRIGVNEERFRGKSSVWGPTAGPC